MLLSQATADTNLPGRSAAITGRRARGLFAEKKRRRGCSAGVPRWMRQAAPARTQARRTRSKRRGALLLVALLTVIADLIPPRCAARGVRPAAKAARLVRLERPAPSQGRRRAGFDDGNCGCGAARRSTHSADERSLPGQAWSRREDGVESLSETAVQAG